MCGVNRACIESGIRATFERYDRESNNDFAALEARVARERHVAPDGQLDRNDIDHLVGVSGTSNFITRGPIVNGIMGEVDSDRSGGISAREWMNRRR